MERNEKNSDAMGITLALDRASKGIYLGDPTAVLKIVGEFAYKLFDDPDAIESDIERMGRIFTGNETGYSPQGSWSDNGGFGGPAPIATHLKEKIKGLDGDDDQHVVRNAFGVLAIRLLEQYKALKDSGTLDTEWFKVSRAECRAFASLLTGLPS
jgi:hypothetical protein